MARTQLTSREIGSVQRNDLDTTTTGEAVVRKLIAGTNITFSSTGVDAGTGDVTINASGGGSISIGTSIGSATAGSVLFAGASGVLAQDNATFFYDDSTDSLKLGSSAYTGTALGSTYAPSWSTAKASLKIGFDTAYLDNAVNVYGALIDMHRSQTAAGSFQTSAMRSRAWIEATSSATANCIATSVEAFVDNKNSTVATNLQAIEGIVNQPAISQWTAGGYFQVINAANTSFEDWGVTSAIDRSAGSTPIAVIYDGILSTSGTGTMTEAYGLRLDYWSGTGISNSYGIYLGTAIDRGTVSKYAIKSDSTSPSVFAGKVGLGTGTNALSAKLQVRSTTEQLRLEYDATNYLSFTVASTGGMFISPIYSTPSSATVGIDTVGQVVIGDVSSAGNATTIIVNDPGHAILLNAPTSVDGDLTVSSDPYDAGWSGNDTVPTKRDLYTKIQSMSAGSGIARSIVITSGSATMGATASTDYVYLVAAAHTMTLPTAVSNTNRYTVKNNHTDYITVNTTSSQTIDGTTSILVAPGASVDLISNNANWFVI